MCTSGGAEGYDAQAVDSMREMQQMGELLLFWNTGIHGAVRVHGAEYYVRDGARLGFQGGT